MSVDVKLTITGVQEAQRANLRAMRAVVQTGQGMTRALALAGLELHRYAVAVTHVDTGALRASHRLRSSPGRVELHIDPNARGIKRYRTGGKKIIRRRRVSEGAPRPAEYGPLEHARGGEHAFYERTYTERGPEAVNRATAYLRSIMD